VNFAPTGLGTSAARIVPTSREPAGPRIPELYCPDPVRDDPALGAVVNERLVERAAEIGIYRGKLDKLPTLVATPPHQPSASSYVANARNAPYRIPGGASGCRIPLGPPARRPSCAPPDIARIPGIPADENLFAAPSAGARRATRPVGVRPGVQITHFGGDLSRLSGPCGFSFSHRSFFPTITTPAQNVALSGSGIGD
jgi:hypothetical protein